MYGTKSVKIENRSIDVNAKVELDNGGVDDPIRIKSVGGRRWVVAICMCFMVGGMTDITRHLANSNKLKEEDIKIKREQLELARRQFVLDSIALEQNRKIR